MASPKGWTSVDTGGQGFWPNASGTSGAAVGGATAAIRIDTSSIAQDGAAVVRTAEIAGKGIERGLSDGADKGAKNIEKSMQSAQRSITALLTAIAAFGVKSAQSVKSLEARFRLLAGSEEEATEQLEMLRDMAEKTGQPFLNVVEGAMALMPALRGSNAELDKTLLLTQRLAILDPAQGVEGAAFAIREFLNGEYLSLVRRLELDRGTLKKIRDDAQGDQAKMIQGLSDYIDTMGVTEQALYDMGQTGVQAFAVLKSEATETAANVFEPFLNDVLLPIVEGLSDLLRELRDVNPELKKFVGIAAGVGGVAAAGQYGLPLVGKVPGGSVIGGAALLGGAAYGGAQLGGYIARSANIGGTGDMTQGEVMAQAGETLKQAIGVLIIGFANGVKIWIDIVYTIEGPVNDLIGWFGELSGVIQGIKEKWDDLFPDTQETAETVANTVTKSGIQTGIIQGIADLLGVTGRDYKPPVAPSTTPTPTGPIPENAVVMGPSGSLEPFKLVTDQLDAAGQAAEGTAGSLKEEKSAADKAKDSVDAMVISILETTGIIPETSSAIEIFGGALGRIKDVVGEITDQVRAMPDKDELVVTDELLDEWDQLQTDLKDLEAEYNQDREDELRAFEEKKASIIASYQDRVTEIVENAQIAYERALKQAQDREAAIRENLVKTIAESDKDYAKKVAEINEDYQQDEIDATKAHLDRMARIQRDGQAAIADAAAHLDAAGLFEATRSLNQKLTDEQKAFQDERAMRRRRYQEALDDAAEAHDEQIEAAKENAKEQTELLWKRFNDEQKMREEDTRRRLQQLRKEHRDRLTELQRQHTITMNELAREYQQENASLNAHFAETLMKQNQHLGALREIEQQHREQLEQDLRDWWDENGYLYMPPTPSTGTSLGAPGDPGQGEFAGQYQHGGAVRKTGWARVHAGEHVLNPNTTRMLSRMMGEPVTQRGLMAAMAGGGAGGTSSVNIENMPIMLPQTGQQYTRYDIEKMIERKVSDAVKMGAVA